MKILLLNCFLFSCIACFGQSNLDGFFVDMNGDTTYGKINADINADLDQISFIDLSGQKITLSPNNTKAIQGPLFGKLSGGLAEGLFVQTLMEGTIDVHKSKDTLILIKNGTNYRLVLNEKSASVASLGGVSRNQQLGTLKLLTHDIGEELYKPNTVRFNFLDLTKLFRAYNEKAGSLVSDYTKLNRKLKFSWGPSIGAAYTSAAYSEIENLTTSPDPYEIGHLKSFDKNFGLSLKFRNMGRYHRIAFEVSPFVALQNLTSNLNYNTTAYNNDIASDIKMTSLNLPIIFDYSIRNTEKSYLYFNFGLNSKFNFNTSFDATIVRTYLSVQGLEPIKEQLDKTNLLADAQFAPIVGLSYLTFKKASEIEVALRYQYVSQYMRTGPGGFCQNISLTLYYRFYGGKG